VSNGGFSEGKALNDRAMAALCWLVEQPIPRLAPDAVRAGHCADVYRHLREIELLALSNDMAGGVLCRDCGTEVIQPVAANVECPDEHPYQGYCPDCGWVQLTAEDARWWQAQPTKVARWLNSAIKLSPNYRVETIIDGVLWRLGEREFNRRRHVIFFGRRLVESATAIVNALSNLSAPGAEIIVTTSEIESIGRTPLRDRQIVPLRGIAHLRKAGFVVENFESFIPTLAAIQTTDETSLRLMHTRQIALIAGQEFPLSPQVYAFMKILEDADGDEVHKRHIAKQLGLDVGFRKADVFKRHKEVFDTFAEYDSKGNYWLKPEFVIVERG
jgi:hypothetical protein